MSAKAEMMVMETSDEAASIQTVTGWVSRTGQFWGNDEHMARYCGSTHKKCEGCGNVIEQRGYCQACNDKRNLDKFVAMERKPWDGFAMIYSDAADKYFEDIESVMDHCANEDVTPTDLRLIICEPTFATEIDGSEHFSDDLPEDGELPDELEAAFDALNKAIRACKRPLSWSPSNVALEIDDEGEAVFDIKPLPFGTLNCPRDNEPLHFEQICGMRASRHNWKSGLSEYNSRCPKCFHHYAIHAKADKND